MKRKITNPCYAILYHSWIENHLSLLLLVCCPSMSVNQSIKWQYWRKSSDDDKSEAMIMITSSLSKWRKKNFGADKSEGDDGGEAKIPQSSLGLSYYTQPITNSSSLSSFLSITVQSIPPQPNIIPAKNNLRKNNNFVPFHVACISVQSFCSMGDRLMRSPIFYLVVSLNGVYIIFANY